MKRKKLLSIIIGSAIFSVVTVAIVVPSVVLTRHRKSQKEKKREGAIIRLLRMLTKDDPLKIKYVGKNQDVRFDRGIRDFAAATILSSLVNLNPELFKTLSGQEILSFRLQGTLMPDKVRPVQVQFSGVKVPIYVRENAYNIKDIISQWADEGGFSKSKLKIKNVEKQDSSNPQTTLVLRQAMVQQDQSKTITDKIAQAVTFEGNLYPSSDPDEVITITAFYKKDKIKINVHEDK